MLFRSVSQSRYDPRTNRYLPYKDDEGSIDLPHLRNALSRLDQSNLTDEQKAKAKKKLDAAAKEMEIGDFKESRTEVSFRITEAAMEGKTWEVCVIKSGKSKNGIFYPEELLKNSASVFEGAKVFAHGYGSDPDINDGVLYDHRPDALTFPNDMMISNLAGYLRDVKYKTVEGGGGLYAQFDCVSEGLKKKLLNMQDAGRLDNHHTSLVLNSRTMRE